MLAGGVGRTVAAGAGAAVTGRAAIGGGRPREVPGRRRAAAEGAGVKGMDVCVRFDSSDRTTDRRGREVRARLGQQRFVWLRHRRFARRARLAIADSTEVGEEDAEPMDEVRAVLDRAGLARSRPARGDGVRRRDVPARSARRTTQAGSSSARTLPTTSSTWRRNGGGAERRAPGQAEAEAEADAEAEAEAGGQGGGQGAAADAGGAVGGDGREAPGARARQELRCRHEEDLVGRPRVGGGEPLEEVGRVALGRVS